MSETAPATTRSNTAAIVAFITGLIGLITSVFPFFALVFPGVLDVAAIFFDIRGRRAAASGAPQGGLATAGLLMGAVGLAFFVLWWFLFAIGVGLADGS